MPKEVLHILYGYEEAQPIHYGEPLHINTRGIENVVVQFEKKRYSRRTASAEIVEANGRKLLAHTPQIRRKTDHCKFCQKATIPQGTWKHEKYCEKNPKRTKRGTDL